MKKLAAICFAFLSLVSSADNYVARVIWSPAEVRPDYSILPSTDVVSTSLLCGEKPGEPEQKITVLGSTAETHVRYSNEQWCTLESTVLTYACDYNEAGEGVNCGNRPISTIQSQAFILPAQVEECTWMRSMPVPWGYPHPVLTRVCVDATHPPLTTEQIQLLKPLIVGMDAKNAVDALNAPSTLMVWNDAVSVSHLVAPPFSPSLWISLSEPRRWLWDRLTTNGIVNATDPATRQALRDVWAGPNLTTTRDLITERLQRHATVAEAALAGPQPASPAVLPWSGMLTLDELSSLVP